MLEDGGRDRAQVRQRPGRAQQRREQQPWRPSAWELLREGRWGLAPGAAAAALAVVAGVVVLLVLGAGSGAGSPATPTPGVAVPARTAPAASTAPTSGAAAAATAAPSPAGSSPPEVVVDVTGQVARPGVVRLAPGARVDDALRAAGGPLPTADLRRVNLARLLSDGEQVLVPAPGEELPQPAPAATTAAAATGGTGGGTAATGPVDLNTATAADLDALPGVGPVLAQRILDWRAQHGRFSSVEELGEVSGIGPARLADLTPLLVV